MKNFDLQTPEVQNKIRLIESDYDSNRVWDYTYDADNALYEVKKTQKGNIVLHHSVTFNESVMKDAINE